MTSNYNKHKEEECSDDDSQECLENCQVKIDQSDKLLEKLKLAYEEPGRYDVTLVVGRKEFQVHRVFLCASSDVFHVMFNREEWLEYSKETITLQEIPQCEPVFPMFLEYFYTGKILITHTNVMPILALSDKYMVKGLSAKCIGFMRCHVPHASSHNQLFAWLQYTTACGHRDVSEICQNYFKWNFESVANTADFGNFETDIFTMILEKSDIVVYNEVVLFNCVARWLDLQHIKLQQSGIAPSEIQEKFEDMIVKVMNYIRFPMMTPPELTELVLAPIVKYNKAYFMDRMNIGMRYHRIVDGITDEEEKKLCKPRLYTEDSCSAVLTIDNFWSLPSYHTSTFVFSSHISAAAYEAQMMNQWMVDLYPKGVWFKKCFLIVWQGTLEVPEEVIPTVRLTLTCTEMAQVNMRVKATVLIYGIQNGVEYVMEVKEKVHHFSETDNVMNIDDIIPFRELNPFSSLQKSRETPFLVGSERDQLKLNLVIAPIR